MVDNVNVKFFDMPSGFSWCAALFLKSELEQRLVPADLQATAHGGGAQYENGTGKDLRYSAHRHRGVIRRAAAGPPASSAE
jgi:hypothetical protein